MGPERMKTNASWIAAVWLGAVGCTGPQPVRESQAAQKQATLPEAKAAPESKPAAAAPPVPKPVQEAAFTLGPGVRRGVEGLSFRIPPGVPAVRLHLKLRNKNEYTSYRVLLETAQADAVAEYAATTNPLSVSIPVGALKPGDYVLLLRGRAGGGREEEMDDYHFTVLP